MFEMISKYNRIICQYNSAKIVLHGVRNRVTFQEHEPEQFAQDMGWECVKSYPLQTLKEVIDFANTLNPLENEGFVVRDAMYHRAKIKSPKYIALTHMKQGLTTKGLLTLIQSGEGPEFLSYFPEFTEEYKSILEKYQTLLGNISETFAKYKEIPVQKDFAIAVKSFPYSGILFQLRKNSESNVQELVREMRIEKLKELLKLG
jgi:hypothetical protein